MNTIPQASAPITDAVLQRFRAVAERALMRDQLSFGDGAFLLSMAGPIARELEQRRIAMSVISDLSADDNVVFLRD